MTTIHRLAPDLILIDTAFQAQPEAIGVYLLLGERPALIETGPTSTLETTLQGVRAAGLDPQDLRAVAVTHIHLDHAGATGSLLRRLPHLDVYVHPVGAPHLIDPGRLLVSARRLYGDPMDALFGEVLPVPAERVHPLQDGSTVSLGGRTLTALDTPGHARHHLAYFDPASRDLFTGDIAGVALPGTRRVLAPTPPPEFEADAWIASLNRLRPLQAARLLLTHFGPQEWTRDLFDSLEARIRRMVTAVEEELAAGHGQAAVTERLQAAARAALGDPELARRYEVVMPMWQSALGVMRYVGRRTAQPGTGRN